MFNPIKKGRKPNLRINTPNSNASIPNEDDKKKPTLKISASNVAIVPYEFSDCGSFKEEDLRIGSKGMKIASTSKAPEVDDNLNPDEIEVHNNEILGSGSSCVVKKGTIKKTQKQVALKIMPLNLEEAVRKKVLFELRTLYTCNHDNIVKFFGAYCTDGNVTIVLEFMDLGTLATLIDLLGPMPENVIGEIAYLLLSAINYMNKDLHIVHRDIKPLNILINSQGEVKLSDFGVSGKLENSIGQAMTFAGTVTYMSPERISGKPHTSTSDIWSLGLTLLQCSLGYFPYTPEGHQQFTFFQLLERILNQPAPLPPSDYSPEFKSFISNCLIKDPNERPGAQMIDHPFILAHKDSSRNLKAWINKALIKLGRNNELIEIPDEPIKKPIDPNSNNNQESSPKSKTKRNKKKDTELDTSSSTQVTKKKRKKKSKEKEREREKEKEKTEK